MGFIFKLNWIYWIIILLYINKFCLMTKVYDNKLFRLFVFIWILVSFLMMFDLEYWFYNLWKLVLFFLWIYLVFYIYNQEFNKQWILLVPLILFIVVFNPIFPISFTESTRKFFDFFSWILLIIVYLLIDKDKVFINKMYNEIKQTAKKYQKQTIKMYKKGIIKIKLFIAKMKR